MTVTNSAVFSAAIQFTLQKKLLANLRAELHWADSRWCESGTFAEGSDTLKFANVPDLSAATTPLTEGTNPAAQALSFSMTSVEVAQYGQVVNVTDVAKIKAPIDVVNVAEERLRRSAKVTLDQISRDAIAVGGTPVYAGVGAPANRPAIASTDLLRAADLRRLFGKMQAANIPTFSDGAYLIFIHPYVAYDIKSDDDTGGWIDVNKYSRPETLINGEIGKLEGFRVVVVNNAPTVTSTVTVYQSIAIGDLKGWGAGDLQTLTTAHVPAKPSSYDPLGLNEYMGWKCMYGVGVLDSDYYLRVESAATSLA